MTDEKKPAASDKAAAAEKSEQDAEWGFEKPDDGMATETKIGLALIVVLLAAFAFVVYRKMDSNKYDAALIAEQESADKTDTDQASQTQSKLASESSPPPDPQLEPVLGAAQREPAVGNEFGPRPSSTSQTGTANLNSNRQPAQSTANPFGDPFGESNTGRPGPTAQNSSGHSHTGSNDPIEENPFAPTGNTQTADNSHGTGGSARAVVQDIEDPFFQPVPSGSGNATQDSSSGAIRHASGVELPEELDPVETAQAEAGAGAGAAGSTSVETRRPATTQQNSTDPLDDAFQPVDAQPGSTQQNTTSGNSSEDIGELFGDPISTQAQADGSATSRGSTAASSSAAGTATTPDGFGTARDFPGTSTTAQNAAAAELGGIEEFQPVPRGAFGSGQSTSRPAPVSIDFSAADGSGNLGSRSAGSSPSGRSWPAEAVGGNTFSQPGGTRVYEVVTGDNYWVISKKVYGTPKYFTALAKANRTRIPDPAKMRPGMKVVIPGVAQLAAYDPSLRTRTAQSPSVRSVDRSKPAGFFLNAQGRPMYRIGQSDTLSLISQKHLGRASRWIQIYELNRKTLKNPNDLQIGMELVLPADASRVNLIDSTGQLRSR